MAHRGELCRLKGRVIVELEVVVLTHTISDQSTDGWLREGLGITSILTF